MQARGSGATVLLVTILGSGMAVIDGTVVNLALPRMQQDFGASAASVEWVVEAYALFLSALLLVGGALGDRFGRRKVFAAGVVLFAAASLLCGLSPTLPLLLAARGIQGIGGALLTPGSLALLTSAFPANERGRAIGTWAGSGALAAAIGPVLGGFLVQHASWRWAFLINPPIALAILLLLPRVPESRDAHAPEGWRDLDVTGALLATVGLGALVYGLTLMQEMSSGRYASLLLGAAALLLGTFVLWERRAAAPMLPPGIFRSRIFSGTNLLTFFLYGALGGLLLFLPFLLIEIHHYSATQAGAAFLPFVMVMALLSRFSGGLLDRFGARLPLTVGPLIAGIGFLALGLPGTGGPYVTTFLPGMLTLSLGMALTAAPLTAAVMGAVEEEHAGIASGINNAVARSASLVAVAAFGLMMALVFSRTFEAHTASLQISETSRATLRSEEVNLMGMTIDATLPLPTRDAVGAAKAAAFLEGFRWLAAVACGLAWLSAAIALLVLPRRAAPASTAPAISETPGI
jgi:EmrB/QacA subfamily drug resistance transporter